MRFQRTATLLEVLISISLLSLVLFALLSSYSQIKLVDARIVKETESGFKERYLESRLSSVLLQIFEIKKDKYFFYTEYPSFSTSPSLVFNYYNDAKLDPKFSGTLIGRLFVDRTGKLMLATWPTQDRYEIPPIPMRLEVLDTDIKEISFSFFVPPEKDISVEGKKVGEGAGPERNRWHSEWKKGNELLPPILKLKIVRNSLEEVDFSFYLANNQYPLEL